MKTKSIILITLLLSWGMFIASNIANAYDESVHPEINEHAVRASKLDETLKTKLGYNEGVETPLTGQKVFWWFRQGGIDEDFLARPLLHFHDPLQPWSNAGLWGINSASVDWAQRSDNGESWQKARDHFYQALTTGSEAEFATTFNTLGQLMHLVSDLAVPAHVRNDAHPNGDLYEAWAADKKNDDPQHYVGSKVDQIIFNQALTAGEAPSPITALWDRDAYNGTNPSITIPWILPPMPGFPPIPVSGPMKVGLAEYTNANFFSKDTIFKNYANPSYRNTTPIGDGDWLNPETVPGEDGKPDKRVYVWGYAGGNGNIRLAGASFITRDSAKAGYISPPMVIDDNVNKDYASRLIPAAVGYSTALLDYFFRGDIDLIYDSSRGGYFIANNSAEGMTGTFALYYDDNNTGTRRKFVEWTNKSVAANGLTPVTVPANHPVSSKYFLVFEKGQMGRESGAVAGRVVSLKPFGLLSIAISGNLYNAKGEQSGGAGPTMYIVWDVGQSAPLKVSKPGGGYWSYPISAEEYSGSWLVDLQTMLGEDIEIVDLPELFNKAVVVSTIFSPDNEWNWPRSGDSRGAYWTSSDEIGRYSDTYLYPAAGDCQTYLGQHLCSTYDESGERYNPLPVLENQIATNKYGGVDTWSRSRMDTYREYDSRPRLFDPETANDPDITFNIDNSGATGSSDHCTYSLSFHLPTGGRIWPGMFCGWNAPLTNYYSYEGVGFYVHDITGGRQACVLPRPFLGQAWALTSRNNSGAPVKLIGPEIHYEAVQNSTWSDHSAYIVTSRDASTVTYTSAVQSEVATTGTLATLSGDSVPVGLNFSENISTGSYEGSRQVTYATDSLAISSAYDLTDNLCAWIVVQSIATGVAENSFSPGGSPVWPGLNGTQNEPIYSDMATTYHIRAICAAVRDAATQDPWALADNPGLMEILKGAIAVYVANNPPGGNNHWNISTGIQKIM